MLRGSVDLVGFRPVALSRTVRGRFSSLSVAWHVPAVGLGFKLVVLVIGISLIGVFTSSSLILSLQRQQLLETTSSALTRSSVTIAASLDHAMLHNDRPMISQIIRRMGRQEGVSHVRVLDASGVVRMSSTDTEVGTRIFPAETLCPSCSVGQMPPLSRTITAQSPEGNPVLVNVTPFDNAAECQTCHGASDRVLGALMIETPLTDVDNQGKEAIWQIGISTTATMVLLVTLLLVALRRLVLRPVDELISGMKEIRAGHLDHVIRASSQDELGDLAEAFNSMRVQLKYSLRQARHMATLQERERLAREMHDDLAQKLAYIKTRLWLTNDFLANGQVTTARANVGELSQLTDEAYMDVRQVIYSLRSAIPSKDGLVLSLREYLDDFQSQYGIETSLICPDPPAFEFPADVEAQLTRIIQEALANIRKHSRAHNACVRFEREDGHVQVSIEDDGCGFDPVHRGGPVRHFGLRIMRERAEGIGGQLHINSQPDGGTQIVVRIPLPVPVQHELKGSS